MRLEGIKKTKTMFIFSTVIFVFLAGCAGVDSKIKEQQKIDDQKSSEYLDSDQASIDYFEGAIKDKDLAAKRNNILHMGWYLDGSVKTRIVTELDKEGKFFVCRNVYNWAIQNLFEKQLNKADLEKIKHILSNLQVIQENCDPKDRFMLGFMKNNEWQYCIYNRNKIPAEIKELMKLLGRSFDDRS